MKKQITELALVCYCVSKCRFKIDYSDGRRLNKVDNNDKYNAQEL